MEEKGRPLVFEVLPFTRQHWQALAGTASTSHHQHRLFNLPQFFLDISPGQLCNISVLWPSRPGPADASPAMAVWLDHHVMLPNNSCSLQGPQEATNASKEIKNNDPWPFAELPTFEVPQGLQSRGGQPLCYHETASSLGGIWSHDMGIQISPPVSEPQGKRAQSNHNLINHRLVNRWHVTLASNELPYPVIDGEQGPPKLQDMNFFPCKDLQGLPRSSTLPQQPQAKGQILQKAFCGYTHSTNFSIQKTSQPLSWKDLFCGLLGVERHPLELVCLPQHILFLWWLSFQPLSHFSLQNIQEGGVIKVQNPHRRIFTQERPNSVFPDLQGPLKFSTTWTSPEG